MWYRYSLPGPGINSSVSSDSDRKNSELEQRVKLLEQALQQSARIRQQFNDSQRDLNESRTRYLSLIQHAFDAILIIAKNGAIQEANPTACKLFGLQPDLFGSLTIESLIPDFQTSLIDDEGEQHIQEFKGIKENGEPSSEERRVGKAWRAGSATIQ